MILTCKNCGNTYEIKGNKLQASNCLACHNRIAVLLPKSAISQSTGPKHLFTTNELLKEKHSGIGLIPKVTTLMLAVSLLPLILFACISIRQNSLQLRRDTELAGSQLTLRLAKQIDEWVQKNVSTIQALTQMPDIQSMDPDKQRPLLQAVKKNNLEMVAVFTSGISGRIIAANSDSVLRAYSELLDKYTFISLENGKAKVLWRTMTEKIDQKRVLITAVPIKKDGMVLGTIANAVTLDHISRQMALWKRGTSGRAFIVDEDGIVIAGQFAKHGLQNTVMTYHPLVDAFLRGLYHGTLYFEDSEGNLQLGHVRGTRNGWALAVQQSDKEAFVLLHQTSRFAFILLSLTVVVVLGIAWLAGRSIVGPIKKLSAAADRISMGDLDLKIDVGSKDEIGQLGNSIVRMQKSILMAMNRLRQNPPEGQGAGFKNL